MGYGRRWAAETAFSAFKRLYGEHSMSKNMENITKELAAKAYIYNMLIPKELSHKASKIIKEKAKYT